MGLVQLRAVAGGYNTAHSGARRGTLGDAEYRRAPVPKTSAGSTVGTAEAKAAGATEGTAMGTTGGAGAGAEVNAAPCKVLSAGLRTAETTAAGTGPEAGLGSGSGARDSPSGETERGGVKAPPQVVWVHSAKDDDDHDDDDKATAGVTTSSPAVRPSDTDGDRDFNVRKVAVEAVAAGLTGAADPAAPATDEDKEGTPRVPTCSDVPIAPVGTWEVGERGAGAWAFERGVNVIVIRAADLAVVRTTLGSNTKALHAVRTLGGWKDAVTVWPTLLGSAPDPVVVVIS